ncbi:MAG: sugar phosphate isomerase/epimerase [Akkermansiaceae bacterium]|nr:sugar phosphate isomerase/epimerase [Akkermansiaceae bacterium]
MLSVSHIAWSEPNEEAALRLLSEFDIKSVELAPVRAFGNLLEANEADVRAKAGWYARQGFNISSFQALLFGTSGLLLFADQGSRTNLKRWLMRAAQVAGWCGAKSLVFGSPRNRLRGDLEPCVALEIAIPFFRELGDFCSANDTRLLIEPNPEQYGADFCISLEESITLVRAVDSPGFGLHLDAGGLAISGESFAGILERAADLVHHVHASQPDLSDWKEPDPIHRQVASALRSIGYSGGIALEMKKQEDEFGALRTALGSLRNIYQSPP